MRFPILDGVGRTRLAAATLVGRRVVVDVPTDDATEHACSLLATSGAEVVADPTAELAIRRHEVACGGAVCRVPTLDPTGDAHGTLRAVLRLTNRRLAGTRVAVVGYDERRRALAGVVRAFGGRVVVVDDDPLRRLAAVLDGHDLGTAAGATLVFADGLPGDLAAGTVVAGPTPPGGAEEVRPGVFLAGADGRELLVLDPVTLAADRAVPWLDLTWAGRLVALSWTACSELPAGSYDLPVELRRQLAAAALDARGVSR